jgi:hypothetical protein
VCLVSKPKIPQNSAEDNKPLPILRNTFLDGMLGNIAAARNGRNSLRIPLNPLGIPVGGGIGGGIGVPGGPVSGGSSGGGAASTSSPSPSTGSGGSGGPRLLRK